MSRIRVALALLAVQGASSCADDAGRGSEPSGGGQPGTGGASGDASSGGHAGLGGAGGGAGAAGADASGPALRVTLFSKTTGFRHDSIAASIAALSAQGAQRGWQVDATEDSVELVSSLPTTDVVVFLNTSGDVLDAAQQSAFQSWLATGRGWVGVHAASDTEYDWPWYGELVGAWFLQHPSIQNAKLRVERQRHLATEGLPSEWSRSDEWYAFKTNPRANVQVVLSLDEASFDPGNAPMGDHPVAWYHGFGGGRAFYTALGHTIESWNEPAFLAHVSGGIEWAGGREHPQSIVEEFDEAHQNGLWAAHAHPTGFAFEVAPGLLTMHDKGDGVNQHVVRRGVAVDAARPYVVEALFTIAAVDPFATNMNSFALNLNVGGADGDFGPPSTWSVNVDLPTTGPGGVMKYMGFQAGSFAQLGERTIDWGVRGTEYLLRVGVGLDKTGSPAPKKVTTTVTERGIVREHYDVDYAAFPYQPEVSKPVRLGANTHATDWVLRGLRAFYAD